MNVIENLIKSNLSLDIRTDLEGNEHICLLFGDEVISSIKIDRDGWL